MESFEGQVVIITGGATGIGFALAKRLGQDGAHIIIAETRKDRLEESAENLSSQGVTASYFVCDVSDKNQVETLASNVWEQHGKVDVLMNNAGVAPSSAPVSDTPIDDLRWVFEVNVFGVWNGCSVFGRRMAEQTTPSAIYNTGSENSLFNGLTNAAAYVASKHAVLGLTDAFRAEMPDHVHVGTIFPGFVQSELVPKPFLKYGMDTDQFADIVVQQMYERPRYIVSHAHNMVGIQDRYDRLASAYEKYAPRYDGDDEYHPATVRDCLIAEAKEDE